MTDIPADARARPEWHRHRSAAHGEKIFEPEPEEVVPGAVAGDEVFFVGVVASGALIGKITIAVHVEVKVLEVAGLEIRIQKQSIEEWHLQVSAHQEPQPRPFAADHSAGDQCRLLLGVSGHSVHVGGGKTKIFIVEGKGQVEDILLKFSIGSDHDALAESPVAGEEKKEQDQPDHGVT